MKRFWVFGFRGDELVFSDYRGTELDVRGYEELLRHTGVVDIWFEEVKG